MTAATGIVSDSKQRNYCFQLCVTLDVCDCWRRVFPEHIGFDSADEGRPGEEIQETPLIVRGTRWV